MTRRVIYWLTNNPAYKRAIKDRFRIRGETVNGESDVFTRGAEEDALLRECARRGLLMIRNK